MNCVVVGFGLEEKKEKTLYFYEDVKAEPRAASVKKINAYLIDASNVVIESRTQPLCSVPPMSLGNQPIDGGNYLFSREEMEEFIKNEPGAKKWFRQWYGSQEFINRKPRYFLFLKNCPPHELKNLPKCLERIQAVVNFRNASKRPVTRELAATPREFAFENISNGEYIVVPEVSSERRRYIPIGFFSPDVLCSNLVKIVPNATLYHFGVLTGGMHMAWTRCVCGRLEMRYRYSSSVVYNNFPWPVADAETQAKIADAAQGVLDARALFPNSSLADLYDPLATPPALVKAHEKLDRLVERAYRPKKFDSDAERVAFLFERYRELVDAEAVASEDEKRKKRERLRS